MVEYLNNQVYNFGQWTVQQSLWLFNNNNETIFKIFFDKVLGGGGEKEPPHNNPDGDDEFSAFFFLLTIWGAFFFFLAYMYPTYEAEVNFFFAKHFSTLLITFSASLLFLAYFLYQLHFGDLSEIWFPLPRYIYYFFLIFIWDTNLCYLLPLGDFLYMYVYSIQVFCGKKWTFFRNKSPVFGWVIIFSVWVVVLSFLCLVGLYVSTKLGVSFFLVIGNGFYGNKCLYYFNITLILCSFLLLQMFFVFFMGYLHLTNKAHPDLLDSIWGDSGIPESLSLASGRLLFFHFVMLGWLFFSTQGLNPSIPLYLNSWVFFESSTGFFQVFVIRWVLLSTVRFLFYVQGCFGEYLVNDPGCKTYVGLINFNAFSRSFFFFSLLCLLLFTWMTPPHPFILLCVVLFFSNLWWYYDLVVVWFGKWND